MDDAKIKKRAVNNAYALLRQRPRSEREMRDRLRLKGYEPAVIEEVVGGLRRSGELDDAKFAKVWIESRMRSNPAGDAVLRLELRSKGVADAIIASALEKRHGDYDDREIALKIAKEKFRRFAKLDKRKAMKRVFDFLMRRGFRFDAVQDAIGKLDDED